MSKSVKSVTVLVAICAIMAILLGITNAITAPFIAENEAAKENSALLEVLPSGKSFERLDLTKHEGLPVTLREAYKEVSGGFVLKLETTGYSSGMVIMVGVNADLTVAGTKCISSTETPGIGGAAMTGYETSGIFVGKDIETVGEVDTVGGATKTTAAYRSAVKDAIGSAIILGGGSVDLRTEEEILNDNLSAALPEAGGEFEKVFHATEISIADAYYKAKNGAGYVAIVRNDAAEGEDVATELFYAANAEGVFGEDAPEGLNEELAAELTLTYEDIDKTGYEDINSALTAVLSAKRASNGNYVLEMRAAGYGINGGDKYHPASGKYITLKVSITKDGKIIDCVTLTQEESTGIGDMCAKEDYYGQFDGKTESEVNGMDTVSGVTFTTQGYKTALLRAFIAVGIFEGGNE